MMDTGYSKLDARRKLRTARIVFAFIAVTATDSANAQNEHTDDAHEEAASAESHHHKNHAGVFVGATWNRDFKNTDFTAGVDYLRRFGPNRKWAAGFVTEIVFAEHPEYVGIAMLYRTVVSGFFVRTGPGFVNGVPHAAESGLSRSDAGSEGADPERETAFILRVGIGYDVELKNGWAVEPTIDVDFAGRNEFWVIGAAIGKAF